MTERKPIEDVNEMRPDAQHDYLNELEIFTEEEWKLYKEVTTDPYHLREITRRQFGARDDTEYLISVERWSDGEAPDEMNTRIHIVKLG
jgi:hypothetical protein